MMLFMMILRITTWSHDISQTSSYVRRGIDEADEGIRANKGTKRKRLNLLFRTISAEDQQRKICEEGQ